MNGSTRSIVADSVHCPFTRTIDHDLRTTAGVIAPEDRRRGPANPQLVEHDAADQGPTAIVQGPPALKVLVTFGAPLALQSMSASR